MRGIVAPEDLLFDLEIERTARRNRGSARRRKRERARQALADQEENKIQGEQEPPMAEEAEEAMKTLKLMANNTVNMQFDRQNRKGGVLEVNTLDAILAQNKPLTQQITNLTQQLGSMQAKVVNAPSLVCDFCGGTHQNGGCQVNQPEKHVNAVGQQHNQYSNNYNSGWRNPSNRPWGG
ncbi:hypothetical protein SESBI_11224 [Sesbania bispinosa]|nr:hypothetical protein SESBI_11224 [Sesbania bispinosa]